MFKASKSITVPFIRKRGILDEARHVCGSPIGDKTDASFCLKPAGTCTVTQDAGWSQSLWCKDSRLDTARREAMQ